MGKSRDLGRKRVVEMAPLLGRGFWLGGGIFKGGADYAWCLVNVPCARAVVVKANLNLFVDAGIFASIVSPTGPRHETEERVLC